MGNLKPVTAEKLHHSVECQTVKCSG